MPGQLPVIVEGVALELSSADGRRSLPELIFDCVTAALVDAGTTMQDVDAVTLAAEDLIDGRSLSSMITGPAAGAYLRDEMRVSEDGLVALSLGAAQVASGTFGRVLVAAWGRASEGDPTRASRQGFDPFTGQPLGLSELTISALRASALLRRDGPQTAERQLLREQRTARAAGNPRRPPSVQPPRDLPFPVAAGEARAECDAVAAVVLGHGQGRSDGHGNGVARVSGVGHGTDSVHLGDRPIRSLPSAGVAIALALEEAGLGPADLDVLELGARTVWDEAQMLESAGFAEVGGGLTMLAADPRVNASGGSTLGDCEPASGLVRFVEAVYQLTGRSGENQLLDDPARALVCAGSALAGQTHVAVVVQR